jgi:hypothetical protein
VSNMKNRLLLFIILTLFISSGYQSNAQKFYGGLHLGINGSQIWGDKMAGFDKGGLLAGVFIDYPLSDDIFLTMELDYTEKGSRAKDGLIENSGSWNMAKLSYLEVPIFFNYRLTDKFDLIIGLSYGIKVAHNYIESDGTENPDYDFTKSYDFGINGGVNYHLSKKFLVSIRAFSSLITIGKEESNPIWARTNRGFINNVVSCSLKYYFLSPNK